VRHLRHLRHLLHGFSVDSVDSVGPKKTFFLNLFSGELLKLLSKKIFFFLLHLLPVTQVTQVTH
jgi:hypothetical protein